MIIPLPSKDTLVQACGGPVTTPHPILIIAHELAELHTTRAAAAAEHRTEIDSARDALIRAIDRWVAANTPPPLSAAYLHSETIGMVVDRLAQYSVDARIALETGSDEPRRHQLWQRLSELSLAYADLAFEITSGLRKLPEYTHPSASPDAKPSR
jgi:hypothetical protein